MTLDLDLAKRLCAEATCGPWTASNHSALKCWLVYPEETRCLYIGKSKVGPEEPRRYPLENNEANAAFIAHARTALPLAIEWIEDLAARIDGLIEDVKDFKDVVAERDKEVEELRASKENLLKIARESEEEREYVQERREALWEEVDKQKKQLAERDAEIERLRTEITEMRRYVDPIGGV